MSTQSASTCYIRERVDIKIGENKFGLKFPTKILTRLNSWHVSALVWVNKILYHNYWEQVISEARLAILNDSLTCEKEFGQNWSCWLCRSNVKVTQPGVLSFNWVFSPMIFWTRGNCTNRYVSIMFHIRKNQMSRSLNTMSNIRSVCHCL